jgi:hypothetical protein
LSSASYLAAKVRDVPIVEPADEAEFDVIATETVEQPSAAAEKDLDEMISISSISPARRRAWAAPAPWTMTGRSPAAARA